MTIDHTQYELGTSERKYVAGGDSVDMPYPKLVNLSLPGTEVSVTK